jgi:hypothetical protein
MNGFGFGERQLLLKPLVMKNTLRRVNFRVKHRAPY